MSRQTDTVGALHPVDESDGRIAAQTGPHSTTATSTW